MINGIALGEEGVRASDLGPSENQAKVQQVEKVENQRNAARNSRHLRVWVFTSTQ